ncbi:MAG: LysM peptidoglycan-binding domain-containing protein [Treponema sp.]|jgi:murein DD-endopeptidase MepM/ murein hydrolase activator NlpD|nr:LysM peptidoglycan-binding domain-containing protein [Treponema sp.]
MEMGEFVRKMNGKLCARGSRQRRVLMLRVAALGFSAVLLIGAVVLVSFAIISPELPPENLISTINDIAAYYEDPDNDWSISPLVLPQEEKSWAAFSIFQDKEEITGSGTPANREEDVEYRVRPGETLSEIAYAYDLPFDLLAWYNNINNANRIRVGATIIIPSVENARAAEIRMASAPKAAVPARTSTQNVTISFESRNTGDSNVSVRLFVVEPHVENLKSFEWDLGDGKRSFQSEPVYEYSVPKTYVVRLTARDNGGTIFKSNSLYIDIPHPGSMAEQGSTRFVTLSSPDEMFVVNGEITKVARYASVDQAPLDLSESDNFLTRARFTESGYYGLTVMEPDRGEYYYSVFVSPLPSMHADANLSQFNWYRTQYNTGTASNCGPASAAMAISWGTGRYFPVSTVRQAIGWQGDGGTSFEQLVAVIKKEGVNATIEPLRSVQNVKDVIDSGSVAIVLFHTDGIKISRQDPASSLFGRYYTDSVGHYIVIKGYSLNGEYFIINDPIPSDWGTNRFRYPDEISMAGRNRYYSSAELMAALRRSSMIVIPRAQH